MGYPPGFKSFMTDQLPALLWAAAIFISSSIPSSDLPSLGVFTYDKMVHFLVFLTLCYLLHRALTFQGKYERLSTNALLFSIIATVLYGALDEFHQMFVPGRDASIYDLAADALGGILYAAVIGSRLRLKGQRKRP